MTAILIALNFILAVAALTLGIRLRDHARILDKKAEFTLGCVWVIADALKSDIQNNLDPDAVEEVLRMVGGSDDD